MGQRGEYIWERIRVFIICLMIAVITGLLVWGAVKINSVSIKSSNVIPVLYQEKSVPVEATGAIPDTDSNDEGMLDREKEPTVINL